MDTPFSVVSLIPTMSSNTSDICEVSSIGDYQSYYSYKAFDNDDTTYWASTTNNYGYLNIHFFTAQTVVKIGLKARSAAVKDFEIWGSNDNFATHDVLLSAVCQNSSDIQMFDLTTTRSYSYYRLNVLNVWTTDAKSVAVVQLNLMGNNQSDITILDTKILNDKYVYQYTKTTDEAIEIGSDTDYSLEEKIIGTWIDGKPIYEKVSLIPITINDDNKITGTSFASSEYSSGNRNYAFDDNTTSNWAPAQTSNPSYIGYSNTEEFIFDYATATIRDAGDDTEDWYIEGSNDGTTWTRISEIVNHASNTPSGTTYTFNSIDTTNAYTNIRLYTTSGLLPSDSLGKYTTIGTLRFYKKLFNDDYDTIIKNDKIHDNSYYILQYTKTTD